MPYRIAGIDVHKKMLAVVVADVEVDGDFHFERPEDRHDTGRPASPGRLAGGAGGRGNFGTLEPVDVKRLRQLEQENGRLKKMVADRDLELDVLKEITRKNSPIATERRNDIRYYMYI